MCFLEFMLAPRLSGQVQSAQYLKGGTFVVTTLQLSVLLKGDKVVPAMSSAVYINFMCMLLISFDS